MIVVAYGLLLPQAVLAIPRHGCLNMHASLLPRWRGAAPIQRAIQAGDERSGVSIMQMEAGLDTGPELLRPKTPIAPRETGGRCTTGWRRSAPRPSSPRCRAGPRGRCAPRRSRTRAPPTRQAAQGRGEHRLVARRPSNSIARCAPSIPGRSPSRRWRASRCASGSRSRCRVQRRRTVAPGTVVTAADGRISSRRAQACSSCRHCSFRDASRSRPATC